MGRPRARAHTQWRLRRTIPAVRHLQTRAPPDGPLPLRMRFLPCGQLCARWLPRDRQGVRGGAGVLCAGVRGSGGGHVVRLRPHDAPPPPLGQVRPPPRARLLRGDADGDAPPCAARGAPARRADALPRGRRRAAAADVVGCARRAAALAPALAHPLPTPPIAPPCALDSSSSHPHRATDRRRHAQWTRCMRARRCTAGRGWTRASPRSRAC